MKSRFLVLALLCLILPACSKKDDRASTADVPRTLAADEQKRFSDLTVRWVMQGPGLVGTPPTLPQFSADGGAVFFEWNSPARLDSMNAVDPDHAYDHYLDLARDAGTYRLDVATREITKLTRVAADTTAPDAFAWDRARRRRAEIRGGDVFLVDLETAQTCRVTQTVAAESNVQIAPDGTTAYFQRGNDLYAVAWAGYPVRQVTNLQLSADPDAEESNPHRKFIVDQQKKLFAEFKDRGEAEKAAGPEPVYLGAGLDVTRVAVSPTGRYAAVVLNRPAGDGKKPVIPLVVTESGYVETEEVRTKVGDAQDVVSIVFVDLDADTAVALDVDESLQLEGLSWSPTQDTFLVRAISADWHERFFIAAMPGERGTDGKARTRVLDRFHDAAWVDGPSFYETGAWMPDGESIYFIAEPDEWGHLYTVSLSGRRTQLTRGAFEVHQATYDEARARWYLITNEERPGSRRLWSMDADGSNRRLVTPKPGEYEVVFSPDMARAAVRFSPATAPFELFVLDLGSGEMNGPLTQSTTTLFRSVPWLEAETVTLRASDGVDVWAHVFRPERFGGTPNGAGVIFIHGAGYLQNVVDGWSYYYREFMFNSMLAARGYTVLNVDYRGSAGYGRDCRTAIYKHMGGRDLDDIIDGARYLVREHGVGEGQVGVYGGSYGGFLTLMALFKYPETITSGAALRSVTDWVHYNHWYTVRILGTPVDDPAAYERSSPIYFAEGFAGHLVMLHGLRDDNVLAEDVIRLSQRLIELGKVNWELALHPVERHPYQRASSWTDQMTRAYALFERTLREPDRSR